jgi:transcriptional regulator with XRE-family HTH domain
MGSIPSENQRFKDWMEQTKRSAGTVANDLGVSRAVLSHILTGRNKLSLSVVQHAARVYSDFDLEFVVLGSAPRFSAEPPKPRGESTEVPTPYPKNAPKRPAYDQLILVRDGKFHVLIPDSAEL